MTSEHSILVALRSHVPAGTVVAAVSGGADSMAMLHGLGVLASERPGLNIVVAHFDHRLRANSHEDAGHVRRAADAMGARFETGHGDVAAHAATTRQTLEAAGRELRYAFLERVAGAAGAEMILTAHTRDDQVETVLMRILHGAAARGRRGILERRGRIVRPLLSVSRLEVEDYCRRHGIEHVTDGSNLDRRFERNRIRHDVLPDLRLVFPDIDAALLRIAHAAQAEFARAEDATTRRLEVFLQPDSRLSWLLELGAFRGLDDPADRRHLISAALDAMRARTDVTAAHHEQLAALADAGVGAIVDVPGMRVRREHDGLVFTRRTISPPREISTRRLAVPGELSLGGWQLHAERVDRPGAEELARVDPQVAYVCCDQMLLVRFPRAGDRMRPLGMKGRKKLSDLFIDRKIPQRMRAHTPVFESGGEIIWVAGVAVGESARVAEHASDVVRLSATRSGEHP